MATTETTGSTVPRRQLGRYLRDLRNRQHITVKTAATQLEWSEAKIWRIETGQTSLRSLDVEAMCRVYAAPADLTEALMGLAKETKAKGWWQAYGDVIPENFDVYLGLEEAASSIAWYEPELVPGLLQTADYARAIIGASASADDDTDRRVQLRIERQALIRRDRPAGPASSPQRVGPAPPGRRPGGHGRPAGRPGRGSRAAQREDPRGAVHRRPAPRRDDRAVRAAALPGQRRRPRQRATDDLPGRLHRGPVPGQGRRDRALSRRLRVRLDSPQPARTPPPA